MSNYFYVKTLKHFSTVTLQVPPYVVHAFNGCLSRMPMHYGMQYLSNSS